MSTETKAFEMTEDQRLRLVAFYSLAREHYQKSWEYEQAIARMFGFDSPNDVPMSHPLDWVHQGVVENLSVSALLERMNVVVREPEEPQP